MHQFLLGSSDRVHPKVPQTCAKSQGCWGGAQAGLPHCGPDPRPWPSLGGDNPYHPKEGGVPGSVPAACEEEAGEGQEDGAAQPVAAGVVVVWLLGDSAGQDQADVDRRLLDGPIILPPPQGRLHGADDGGCILIRQPLPCCPASRDVDLHADAWPLRVQLSSW